jgi:hypothetical protein
MSEQQQYEDIVKRLRDIEYLGPNAIQHVFDIFLADENYDNKVVNEVMRNYYTPLNTEL